MQRRLIETTIAVLVAVSLTACARADGSNPATTSPSASPSALVSPNPQPLNTQDPATWIISESGIGPFRLGANLKAVTATLKSLRASNYECPNPLASFYEIAGVTISAIVDNSGKLVGVDVGDLLQAPDSTTSDARLPLSGPHTAQGIGYGSKVTELQAAYPSAVRTDYVQDGNFPLYTEKTAAGAWITFSAIARSQKVGSIGVWPGSRPPYEYCG